MGIPNVEKPVQHAPPQAPLLCCRPEGMIGTQHSEILQDGWFPLRGVGNMSLATDAERWPLAWGGSDGMYTGYWE